MEHENYIATLQEAVSEGNVQKVLNLLKNKTPSRKKSKDSEPIVDWEHHLSDCDVLSKLNELGVGINDRCEGGFTPLHWAAFNCKLDSVKKLLDAGADTSLKSNLGYTALHSATKPRKVVSEDQVEIVKALLSEGAEVDAKDNNGDSPLIWAANFGRLIVVKELIEHEAKPNVANKYNQTALHWAAWNGHTEVVKYLIDKDSEVDAKDIYGDTPLTWASTKGNIDVVVKLVEKEGKIDLPSNNDYTPLHWASYHGNLPVVKKLLNDGKLDVNLKGKIGLEAIHRAVSNKDIDSRTQLEVVNYLIECGAKINATDDSGDTPLVWALCEGHSKMVTSLLEMKACLTKKNNIGATMLHWAAFYGQKKWIEKWVKDEGVFKVDVKDDMGRTALFWAINVWEAKKVNEETVNMLIQLEAFVNSHDSLGLTPLHWAAIKGHINLFEILVNNGACTKMKDNDGLTPLQLLVAANA